MRWTKLLSVLIVLLSTALVSGQVQRVFDPELAGLVEARYSPDGRFLAVRSHESWAPILIFDLSQPDQKRMRIPANVPADSQGGLAFTPDGKHLAAVRCRPESGEVQVILIDASTGQPVRELGPGQGPITVTGDGAFVLVTLVSLRDESALVAYPITKPGDPITVPVEASPLRMASQPGSSQVAVAFQADTDLIRLVDAATGTVAASSRRVVSDVRGLAYSRDGSALVSTDSEGFRIWNPDTLRLSRTIPCRGHNLRDVTLSADGWFLLACDGSTIGIWTLSDGQWQGSLVGHPPLDLTLSADGRTLTTVQPSDYRSLGSLVFWDWSVALRRPEPYHSVLVASRDRGLRRVAFSHDGRQLAMQTASERGDVLLVMPVDNGTLGEARSLSFTDPRKPGRLLEIESSGFAPYTGDLVFHLEDFSLVYDPKTLQPKREFVAMAGIQPVAFGPGNILLGRRRDGSSVLADPEGHEVRTLRLRSWNPNDAPQRRGVGFSPDGTRLVIGRDLYDVTQGEGEFLNQFESGTFVAFRPDGRKILGVTDARIFEWDPETNKQEEPLDAHNSVARAELMALSVSPDVRLVATLASDGARLWDLPQRRLLGVHPLPEWKNSRPCDIAVHPQGTLVAIASDHGELVTWNTSDLAAGAAPSPAPSPSSGAPTPMPPPVGPTIRTFRTPGGAEVRIRFNEAVPPDEVRKALEAALRELSSPKRPSSP
jgi:WD40 repeat protein